MIITMYLPLNLPTFAFFLLSLSTAALAEKTIIKIGNRSISPRSSSYEILVPTSTFLQQPAIIQTYSPEVTCVPFPRSAPSPETVSPTPHEEDLCYDTSPMTVADIQILQPAICENGTTAIFTTFRFSSCNGKGTPHSNTEELVGQCQSTAGTKDAFINDGVWSFSFVCNRIKGKGEDKWEFANPYVWALLLMAFVACALAVGLTVLCCGGIALILAGIGLLFWGFWNLVRGILSLVFGWRQQSAVVQKSDQKEKKGRKDE
jgi:hypothetical protein